ncbi:MAG: hypothetical protein PUA68_03320 [Bacilli bacterium]|nr:hypothetical protein [Bacilli bacterium]
MFFLSISGYISNELISTIILNIGYFLGLFFLGIIGHYVNNIVRNFKYLNIINVLFGNIFLLIFLGVLYFMYQGNNLFISNILSFLVYLVMYMEVVSIVGIVLGWLRLKKSMKIVKLIFTITIVFVVSLLINMLYNIEALDNILFQKLNLLIYFNSVISLCATIATSVLYKTIKVD